MLKTISLLGLLLMAAGLVGLYVMRSLFSWSPATLVLQAVAIALMAWARVTLGRRSFHAAADPTAGGLVRTGPYAYIRHPIYTAACLFGLGGVVAHPTALAFALLGLMLAGGIVRMLCEERLLVEEMPGYRDYMKTTKRMVPYVF